MFVVISQLNIRFEQLFNRSGSYFFKKNALYLLLPRQMPKNHLKSYDTKTPNITFKRISVEFQRFRRHVVRRTHIVIKFLNTFFRTDGETEIS